MPEPKKKGHGPLVTGLAGAGIGAGSGAILSQIIGGDPAKWMLLGLGAGGVGGAIYGTPEGKKDIKNVLLPPDIMPVKEDPPPRPPYPGLKHASDDAGALLGIGGGALSGAGLAAILTAMSSGIEHGKPVKKHYRRNMLIGAGLGGTLGGILGSTKAHAEYRRPVGDKVRGLQNGQDSKISYKEALPEGYEERARPSAKAYRASHPEREFLQKLDDGSFDRQIPVTITSDTEELARGSNAPLGSSAGIEGVTRKHLFGDPEILLRRLPLDANKAQSDKFNETLRHELLHSTQSNHLLGTTNKEIEKALEGNPYGGYLSSQEETEAHLGGLKHRYYELTGKVIDTPDEASKALEMSKDPDFWYETEPGRYRMSPMFTPRLNTPPGFIRIGDTPKMDNTIFENEAKQILPGIVRKDDVSHKAATALLKRAAGGMGQRLMEAWPALTRTMMAPLSLPTAAIGMSPDDLRVLGDAVRIGKKEDPVLGRHFITGLGTQEVATAVEKIRRKNPKLGDSLLKCLQAKQETAGSNTTGAKMRRTGRGLAEAMSAGEPVMLGGGLAPVWNIVGGLGELGEPRNLERGLSAEDPKKKPAFLRRWLAPREAGAENFGRAMAVQNPALAKQMMSELSKGAAERLLKRSLP